MASARDLVLDVDTQIEPAISGLAAPYRLIIDLPEVSFEIPDDAGETGRGLVADWRFGLFARGKSRIVMDLTGPVTVDKTFFLPAVDDQPARLVVDLVKSTPEGFCRVCRKLAGPEICRRKEGSQDRQAEDAGGQQQAGYRS
ncbi:AMIN domain-containing protein [Roseibium salinum]|nr:AMIN domain-containing protein [Roseibium salinum]